MHHSRVVGGSRTVANRTAFAELRTGVEDRVCHGRSVEMAGRASRGGSRNRIDQARWIGDGVLPDRENVLGTAGVAHVAVGRIANGAVQHGRVKHAGVGDPSRDRCVRLAKIARGAAESHDDVVETGHAQFVTRVD